MVSTSSSMVSVFSVVCGTPRGVSLAARANAPNKCSARVLIAYRAGAFVKGSHRKGG